MASSQEGLKHRLKEDPATTTTADTAAADTSKTSQKLARAKRGLRSLAAAVSLSVALTAASLRVAGPGAAVPAVSVLRLGFVATAALMALAAWMVWADGAFHRRPAALALFLGQFLLLLSWPPLVLRLGAARAGMAACAGAAAGAAACARAFARANPVAGDLLKPCVAWALLLAVFNYRML